MPKSLNDWLSWLEQLHPSEIELGLERIYRVACRLGLLDVTPERKCFSAPLIGDHSVITVAGTNGKGSCVATLEALIAKSGRSVATYTSPHLHHYCERIRVDGQPVSEQSVCSAFEKIDQTRKDTSLTYFEFGTLAALLIFVEYKIPYIVLEVGLGGRLDAVNVVDADVAVITPIDIDHQQWLGNDRNTISKEKLGITRPGKPLVIAENILTPALEQACQSSPTLRIEKDFICRELGNQQCEFVMNELRMSFELPRLPLASVGAALCVANFLKLDMSSEAYRQALLHLQLPGRLQSVYVDNNIEYLFDVAHNPAAVRRLARYLRSSRPSGRTLAIAAFMADKEIAHMVALIHEEIDHWFIADMLANSRGASATTVAHHLNTIKAEYTQLATLSDTVKACQKLTSTHDRIVVFGSFVTVADVQQCLQLDKGLI